MQWSLNLAWADSRASTHAAVFDDELLVAFTGFDGRQWALEGAAVDGPDAGRVLWTTLFPLGTSLPSAVVAAGKLAVLQLDNRVFAVDPRANGSIAWNVSSPCSLGEPRLVPSK